MTEMTDFQRKISTLLPDFSLSFNEPLKNHTSFRIGGPAEVMVTPKSVQELSRILEVSAVLDTKPYILGAGTNILMPDDGLKGLTVCLKDGLDDLALLDETHIAVGAGVTMTKAAVFVANHGLSGMEFAHGIPGTVGGGGYMTPVPMAVRFRTSASAWMCWIPRAFCAPSQKKKWLFPTGTAGWRLKAALLWVLFLNL